MITSYKMIHLVPSVAVTLTVWMQVFGIYPHQLIVEEQDGFLFFFTKTHNIGIAAEPGKWKWRPEAVN